MTADADLQALRGVALRPVTPEDEPFLFRLYASTRAEELASFGWNAAQQELFLQMQFRAQQSQYSSYPADARFCIIERYETGDGKCEASAVVPTTGEAIGRLYVTRQPDAIHIVDIALLPASRRQGIGGALLRILLEEAAATGKTLRLHVEASNPALRLYRRLGLKPVGDSGVYRTMEAHPPGNSGLVNAPLSRA